MENHRNRCRNSHDRSGWNALRWAVIACVLVGLKVCPAADWPTYGHDSRRSCVTDERLSGPLSEAWVHTATHPPTHAWGDPQPKPVEGNLELPRLRFDDAFHVVAVGDLIYYGSSGDNSVRALEAKTGAVHWTFTTDGPVRLAPTVSKGKVYFGSDDGKVYCLDAANGRVIWTFRAAPGPDRVIGNGKVISLWPVRTGVLVSEGVAYFGAGIFPAEGLYLYAVNADDGKLLWKNDSYAKGGKGTVSPQGYMVASQDALFVPSCRALPAAFRREDGRFLFQPSFSWRSVGPHGGSDTMFVSGVLFNGTERVLGIRERDRKLVFTEPVRRLVVAPESVCLLTGERLVALDRSHWHETAESRKQINKLKLQRSRVERQLGWRRDYQKQLKKDVGKARTEEEKEEAKKRLASNETRLIAAEKGLKTAEEKLKELEKTFEKSAKWAIKCPYTEAMALTRGTVFVGGPDVVMGFDAAKGKRVFKAKVNGKARGIAIAHGRVYVSTDKGTIHCFMSGKDGKGQDASPRVAANPFPRDERTDFYLKTGQKIAGALSSKRGFALLLGGDGRLAHELAKRTEMRIHLVQPDAGKAAAARKALMAGGVYGGKVVVAQSKLEATTYPDYFANLIVCEEGFLADAMPTPPEELLRMLKPCGGVAYLGRPVGADQGKPEAQGCPWLKGWLEGLRKRLDGLGENETKVTVDGHWAKVVRGRLNGAGEWNHQYADPGNTACADDRLVRGPIGIHWFGAPGPGRMPSRHASAAAPLSVGGRMFVQGEEVVMAFDAYNGLKLWERDIPGAIRLGVGWSGCSNLAANNSSIFVAAGDKCLRLDAATGTTVRTFVVPRSKDKKDASWDYVATVGGLLFGSRGTKRDRGVSDSDLLFAYDIESGELRWSHEGQKIMPNTICIGGERVFLVDRNVSDAQKELGLRDKKHKPQLDRRGKPMPPDVRLVLALNAKTGEKLWEQPQYVSDCVKISRGGGELAMMYAKEMLVICGQPLNGHFWGEFFAGEFKRRSLIVLSAEDGSSVWSDHKGYRSRPLIAGDRIIAEPWAYELKYGKPVTRTHPVTGEVSNWQMARPGHHCGSIAAAPNALFFRSGSTAFYDLEGDYGTAHFGAQRPGCWLNCVPANGMVLMPEASSGCVCPFSLQCTIVFRPRKTNRVWGMYSAPGPMVPVKHLAVNFGAPGDRKDKKGTLWLAYPRPRADRLVLDFDLNTAMLKGGGYVSGNADFASIEGAETPWVYAFQGRGLSRVRLPLIGLGQGPAIYSIRLHFLEPDSNAKGKRVFDVKMQAKTVLEGFDIFSAAGGSNRAVVKEFKDIHVRGDVTIELVSRGENPNPQAMPLIAGIEAIRTEMIGEKVTVGEFKTPMETYNFGYWFSDFIRQKAGADIGLVPADAIRADRNAYAAGKVTLGRLFGWLGDRRLVKSKVKGSELLRFFRTPVISERFNPYCPGKSAGARDPIYYAGMKVAYDAASGKVAFELKQDKTYTVASLWPFVDKRAYGHAKPPLADAQKAPPIQGLGVDSKEVLAETTWELIMKAGKAGKFAMTRRYPKPQAEWESWKKRTEEAIAARAKAELEALGKRLAKDMVLPGNVKWRLVVCDDFERAKLGPKWKSLQGAWSLKDGKLQCRGTSFLSFVGKVSAPVRIEFKARSKTPCDLSPFWGTEKRTWREGYVMAFGAHNNTDNQITRKGKSVATSNSPLIVPNKWHHVVGQVLKSKIQLIVDGKVAVEFTDPDPVKDADAAGFYAWKDAEFDDVRIFVGE